MKTFTAKNETVQRDCTSSIPRARPWAALPSSSRAACGKHNRLYPARRYRRLPGGGQRREDRRDRQQAGDKQYHRFTGYIGNLKTGPLRRHWSAIPSACSRPRSGMLPKNPLNRAMYRLLKVYAGPNHPHAAQQPQVLDI